MIRTQIRSAVQQQELRILEVGHKQNYTINPIKLWFDSTMIIIELPGPLSDKYGRIPPLLFSLGMNCLCYTGDHCHNDHHVSSTMIMFSWSCEFEPIPSFQPKHTKRDKTLGKHRSSQLVQIPNFTPQKVEGSPDETIPVYLLLTWWPSCPLPLLLLPSVPIALSGGW